MELIHQTEGKFVLFLEKGDICYDPDPRFIKMHIDVLRSGYNQLIELGRFVILRDVIDQLGGSITDFNSHRDSVSWYWSNQELTKDDLDVEVGQEYYKIKIANMRKLQD